MWLLPLFVVYDSWKGSGWVAQLFFQFHNCAVQIITQTLSDNCDNYNSNTVLLSCSGFSHFPNGLLQHTLHRAALEQYREAWAGAKCRIGAGSYVCSLINVFCISSPQTVLATSMFLGAIRWWLAIKLIMAWGYVSPVESTHPVR